MKAIDKAEKNLIGATLEAAGLRWNLNGWRKPMRTEIVPRNASDPKLEDRLYELWRIIRDAGDQDIKLAVAEFRRLSKMVPAEVVIECTGANLHESLRRTLVNRKCSKWAGACDVMLSPLAATNKRTTISLMGQSIHEHLERLERELMGDSTNPSVKLCVAMALYAYADFWQTEHEFISGSLQQMSPLHHKIRGFTQRRFLKSLAVLEQVRRATKPRRKLIAVED
jgi:hypothetical protein